MKGVGLVLQIQPNWTNYPHEHEFLLSCYYVYRVTYVDRTKTPKIIEMEVLDYRAYYDDFHNTHSLNYFFGGCPQHKESETIASGNKFICVANCMCGEAKNGTVGCSDSHYLFCSTHKGKDLIRD